jgi:hypothetical protein
MIAAPSSPGGIVQLAATVTLAVLQGVIGTHAVLATLIAAACLCATIALLARDVTRELISEITFGTGHGPRG